MVDVVDVNVPRFNQAMVALLVGLGYVAAVPALVMVAFVVVGFAGNVHPESLDRIMYVHETVDNSKTER